MLLDTSISHAYCTTDNSTVSEGELLRIQITTGSQTPIYRQVIDQVRATIASGNLQVGDALPSVRSLASELVVNPNTVAKSYSALVRDGVIESHKGRGYFVAKRREIYTKAEKGRRLSEAVAPVLAEAISLGFDQQAVISEIEKQFKRLSKS